MHRREFLSALGAGAVFWLTGCSASGNNSLPDTTAQGTPTAPPSQVPGAGVTPSPIPEETTAAGSSGTPGTSGARPPADEGPRASASVASPGPPAPVMTRAETMKIFAGQTPRHWGTEAPGVLARLPRTAEGIMLTIDFCGGPGGNAVDHALLTALRQQHIPATLFLNSRWITANQTLAKELAADPLFELANHGTSHSPLSVTGRSAYGIPGTRDPGEVYDEIMTNDARLTELTGTRPRLFRPGTAHLDEVAAEIVRALGVIPVGFTINGDGGATLPASAVTREISRAQRGDIVICHGNHPGGGTAPGLIRALTVINDRGETFRTLPRIIPG